MVNFNVHENKSPELEETINSIHTDSDKQEPLPEDEGALSSYSQVGSVPDLVKDKSFDTEGKSKIVNEGWPEQAIKKEARTSVSNGRLIRH